MLLDSPLVVFYDGIAESDLDFLDHVWKGRVTPVHWGESSESGRGSLMAEAFVKKAPFLVETEHWLKINAYVGLAE